MRLGSHGGTARAGRALAVEARRPELLDKTAAALPPAETPNAGARAVLAIWQGAKLMRPAPLFEAGAVFPSTPSPKPEAEAALTREDAGRQSAVISVGGHIAELKLLQNDSAGRSSLTQLSANGACLHVKAWVVRRSANEDQTGADGAFPDLKAGAAAFRARRDRAPAGALMQTKACGGRARLPFWRAG